MLEMTNLARLTGGKKLLKRAEDVEKDGDGDGDGGADEAFGIGNSKFSTRPVFFQPFAEKPIPCTWLNNYNLIEFSVSSFPLGRTPLDGRDPGPDLLKPSSGYPEEPESIPVSHLSSSLDIQTLVTVW